MKFKNKILFVAMLISFGCGSEPFGKKSKNDSDNEVTKQIYSGPLEGKSFFDLCQKDNKTLSESYLIEMAHSDILGGETVRSDCQKITSGLLEATEMFFMPLRKNENLDLKLLKGIENIKSLHFYEVDLKRIDPSEYLNNYTSMTLYRYANSTLDLADLNKFNSLNNLHFAPTFFGTVLSLAPLANLESLVEIEVLHEDGLNGLPKTKEACPTDAKSQGVREFCENYLK